MESDESDNGFTAREMLACFIVVALLIALWSVGMQKRAANACRVPPAIVGDCDGDSRVTDVEAALCWCIEAKTCPLAVCRACDYDGDKLVEKGEAEWATWNGRP